MSMTTVPRTCEHCGKPFLALLKETNRGDGRFCSPRCSYDSQTRPLDERFWEKVDKNGPIPEHLPHLGPCWLWTGARNRAGYAMMGMKREGETGPRRWRMLHAHRIALFLTTGEWPPAACHRCDNPSCVRPDHLFAGTHADNMRDMREKGRSHRPRRAGELSNSAKLTEAAVRDIRRRVAAGETCVALAEEYGVTNACVSHAATGRTWSHLT